MLSDRRHPRDYLGGRTCRPLVSLARLLHVGARWSRGVRKSSDVRLRHGGDRLGPIGAPGCGAMCQARQGRAGGGEGPAGRRRLVHTGTIPSKTLRETVLNLSGWRERGFYGRSYRVKQDIAVGDLIVRLQKTLDHEVEVLEHQFSRNLVRTAAGEARFVGPNQIEITAANGEARTVSAAHILIACGTRPFRPNYVPFDGKTVCDSDEIIDLPKLPRSLAVIGAGVIGVEYATIFSALDVAVTL